MRRTQRKLVTLRRVARMVAKQRGHDLAPFKVHEHRAGTECRRCGATVAVTDQPAPNDIDISGSAVAVNCGDKP